MPAPLSAPWGGGTAGSAVAAGGAAHACANSGASAPYMRCNGRVQLDAVPPPPFALFAADNPRDAPPFETASPSAPPSFPTGAAVANRTVRNIEATPLSNLFFSRENTEAVQEAIRYRAWVETGGRHVIGRQSDVELLAVMRSIYLQYSRNVPYALAEQTRRLNARVLDYCVLRVVSELGLYERYRHDISQLPVPLAHGQLATTKGSRTLPGNVHLVR